MLRGSCVRHGPFALGTSRCHRYHASSTSNPVDVAFKLYEGNSASKASPLIILHGLFGSKSNWQSLAKGFARDLERPVYALDARNHGESPHDPNHNYTVMAEDVKKFISNHNLHEPIVVGHSMGAKTAMTLALRNPTLIKLLIAVDNAPVDATLSSDFARYVRIMKEIESAQMLKQSEADALLATEEQNIGIRQFLLTNLIRDPDTKVLKWRVPLSILGRSLDFMGDFPLLPHEAQFKKPTLFIRGTYSKYVTDEMIPLIGRFFPRFKIADIDAGHWVHAEKPAEFKSVLTQFILDEEENLLERNESLDSAADRYKSSNQTPSSVSRSSRPHQASSSSPTSSLLTPTSSSPQPPRGPGHSLRQFSSTACNLTTLAYTHDPTTLTDQEYYRLADSSLNQILTVLEEEADRNGSLDVEYSDGVMNITLDNVGTYVINRQPPSRQIWLSSPLSGPKRFDFVQGTGWVYRDGTVLRELLETEWTENGVPVELHGLGLVNDR